MPTPALAPGVDPRLDPTTSPERLATLRATLAAVRRRLFIVRLVRHAYTWAAVSTALAALATVAWTPGTGMAWLWLCAGLVGALAAAAGSAWWRRPGDAAAARAIDRRHNLRGLVDAAREAAGGDDAVSGLIVRDAARALATITIPDTVPFDVPRPRVVGPLLAAGVAWLLAVSLAPSPSGAPDATASGGAAGAGGGLRAVTGDPGAGSEAAEAAASIEARGEGDPSATPDAGGASGESLDRDRAPAREDAAGDDDDNRAASPTPATPDAGSRALNAAEGPGAVPPNPADPRADTSTNDVSQPASAGMPASARQNPDTSPLAQQEQSAGRQTGPRGRSGAAGRVADGAGATAPDGTTGAEAAQTAQASGGVDGGARLGDATSGAGPRTGAAPPADGAFSVRARAARARALGTGGLERMPPDRRALVRNYFRDIGGEAPE
ncbi:MAG: hypothetical protein AB7G23_07420 [Vicinamibacterales bacterium]